MHPQDIQALEACNPKRHIYLEVTSEDGKEHLRAAHKNWFGRFLMWLGISSASKRHVLAYLITTTLPEVITAKDTPYSCIKLLRLFKNASINNTKASRLYQAIIQKKAALFYGNGIERQGFYCYMNAVLQALVRIPFIQNIVYSNKDTKTLSFTQPIQPVFNHLLGKNNVRTPLGANDAKDLLRSFLNNGWEEALKKNRAYTQLDPFYCMASAQAFYDDFFAEKLKFLPFSMIKSTRALKARNNQGHSLYLLLRDVQDGYTLQEALTKSVGKNTSYGYCLFEKNLPEVLPIFLSSRNDPEGQKPESQKPKGQKRINKRLYASETITLLLRDNDAVSCSYDLKSAIIHEGPSINSGHFYTVCLQKISPSEKRWVLYNDETVRAYPEDSPVIKELIANKGHCFFYTKKA